MVVDGGSGKKRAAAASIVRVAQSLRATGGVTKKREGKSTHKLVRGVKIGGAKLRKNSVVKGIKIVDDDGAFLSSSGGDGKPAKS